MFASRVFTSSGGGPNYKYAKKAIRLVRHGCANRPFYHIVVMMKGRNQTDQPIEQLGTVDPMPNERNEKLVALNLERIQYWVGEGADVSVPVSELLGLAGFLPVHPKTYMTAWRNRRASAESARLENQSDGSPEPSSSS